MGLYTKKPVTIEAVLYRLGEYPSELDADVSSGRIRFLEDGLALIDTLEGSMTASPGDWIIRGVKGELYPCKPDIFEATYSLASRAADAAGKPAITRAEADASLSAAPAPRVTVESMEAKVASAEYFRSKTLTICILTLSNGFTIVGKSACASPENYNQALGERYAYDDAFRQIWAFEGYLLREKLASA
jgi:hypothetical protein